ncbi:MAG TPA: hypothetical protein VI072_27330, partial [Polyangiaceae bacterium]
ITGNAAIGYDEMDRIVVEVLWGFVIAFGIVIALIGLLFRSARLALLSIVPNSIPVAVCFLVMRLFGLDLRFDNSLVMCVCIGGLFNTTIQLLACVMREIRSGARVPDEIVGSALQTVGPPSFYTAAILALGLSVLAFSSFPTLRAIGSLSSIMMLAAFAADVTLTTTLTRALYGWSGAFAARSR